MTSMMGHSRRCDREGTTKPSSAAAVYAGPEGAGISLRNFRLLDVSPDP